MAIDSSDVSKKVWDHLEVVVAQWPRQVEYPFVEFAEMLGGMEGFSLVPAHKRKNWDPDLVAGAQDVVLSVGRIHWSETIQVTYQILIIDGGLYFAPSIFSSCWGSTSMVMKREIEDALTAALPKHRIPLPEPCVPLPVPEWVTSAFVGNDPPHSVYMFVSEAKDLWADFVAQNPFVGIKQ